jgi:choline dehydrogenase-like flavoprotein
VTPLLGDAERRTLAAVCDAFAPKLDPSPSDSAALFALSAADVDLAGAVETAMGALTTRQRRELRLFMRLLGTPIFMLLVTGRVAAFASLKPLDREVALLRLANSPLPPVRTGFQALKRLASFLFYSVSPAGGPNPAAQAMGYAIPPRVPGRNALTLSRQTHTERFDVCVVGSGAAGGVVAARLAKQGRRVIVLEAGPPDQADDFDQREIAGTQRLYLDQGTTTTRDLSVAILAGSALGGGTAVNWQTCLRLPDFIREEWCDRSGLGLFDGDTLTAAYDAVSARVSVGTDESARNGNNTPLQRGCNALGFHWTDIARNARGCDLAHCGFCAFGCRVGGKQSTANTFLADAQRDGNTIIVASCRADRIRFERGRTTGVDATVRTADGAAGAVRIDAPTVVVAAGAIETPALLLRSGVEHRELGRNLHLHPTTAVAGRYDEPVRGWLGAPQTVMSDHFARLDGNYGYRLETAPVHPGLIAMALPWHGARKHRDGMQHAAHTSAFIVLSRDRSTGRVRVERDGRAVIDYSVAAMESRLLQHGVAVAARVHHAAGAREIVTLHSRENSWARSNDADFEAWCRRTQALPMGANRCAVFSAHQMGTCRIGRDPRSAVCDETGRVNGRSGLYVADASLFPASSGVNPMLTIMALASVIAERVKA